MDLPIIQPSDTSAEAASSGASTNDLTSDPLNTLKLKPQILEVLHTVFDPEIPVNIYELGLIYDVIVDPAAVVGIRMTLTSPGCPAAQSLPVEVDRKVRGVPGVTDVKVDVVWDPPWDKDKMSDAAKLQLGMF